MLRQIKNCPEGQFVAIFEGAVVGYCASSRVDEAIALGPHDWATITGNGFGSRHDPTGDWLYGIEMAVDARRRGLRIGKRLYEARRALAERLELSGRTEEHKSELQYLMRIAYAAFCLKKK